MKLRIKGNSLRLRVSRSEFDQIVAGNTIEMTVCFGPQPEATLTYALKSDPAAISPGVQYDHRMLIVSLPKGCLQQWSETDQVGIYAFLETYPGLLLELIVEKDFACLDLSDADNEDTFVNPHAGMVC